MKKVLGLDIGTNSIGAALINLPEKFEDYGTDGNIEWIGSRILPMDGDYLQKFESGTQAETKAAFRRQKRGARRLKHRYKLRRTRLIKVFKALGWLNEDFPLDESRKFKQDIKKNGYSFKISDYLPFSEQSIAKFEKELGIDGKKSKKKGVRKGGKSTVPEDWVIYFLRKKALTQKVEIAELVRIIYMLNQRRGFKSSRKDLKDSKVLPYDEFINQKENPIIINDEKQEIETQFVSITKIKSVTLKEEKKDKKGSVLNVYTIVAEDPRVQSWEEVRRKEPEWIGKESTLLVTQKVDKNGKHTQNKPQNPREDNWALCTTALNEKIEEKKQYPGEFFFNELKKAFKEKRDYKIRQYPVYRWRYQKELEAIWKKQCELNPKLQKLNKDPDTLIKLAHILYPTQAKHNLSKLSEFKQHDLLHIISNDIIYYQRELKSQKNSISECRYEKRKGIDGEYYGLKCIPRSSPLFQEFRIWQDIHNIKVLKREDKVDGKTKIDTEADHLINESIKEKLFELFNSKESIKEVDILKLIQENNEQNDIRIAKKGGEHSHRINLFANRDSLKGNEIITRYRSIFKKAGFDGEFILNDKERLLKLWHIDYSISSSDEEKFKKGIVSAFSHTLSKRKKKKTISFDFPKKVIDLFLALPELKKEYGSYSACAIKKFLPVMRCGKYWNKQDISESITQRAVQIEERLESINHNIRRLGEIADDDIQKQVLKSFLGKEELTKGLNTYQAGYLIYDKHSEKDRTQINTVEELSRYIQKEIPNNSLRNPVVEKVVRETMFLVRDVWNKYCQESGIDEIHIELGRNLKNNLDERKKIYDNQKSNFEEKQKIKKLLYELMNDGFEQYVDEDDSNSYQFIDGSFEWKTKIEKNKKFEVNPNPESPVDIDKFRLWRSLSKHTEFEWEKKVKEEKIPTEQEIKKYALWLSQNCRSPYTGKIIPLSKLFDINQYEIEHVIPRSKMKNDSLNNLVISEWGINKIKDKQLAANFIAESNGKCKYGNIEYQLFSYEEYEAYCKDTFKFQKGKLKNLLTTEVPEDFVERQLNDTRYIGRKLSELLAPVAKNENAIIFTGGSITSELKNNWGLNTVWKDIVRPRFERLEKMMNKRFIIPDERDANKYHFDTSENPSLELKRIDHRHHALDALIIAATTREHIRYLNTLNAADTDEEIKKYKRTLVKGKIREFKEPWNNFTKDAKEKLEETIVSFKTNNKITSKPKNRTTYLKIENGKIRKDFREQKSNSKWMAVRRSMFKEPLGIVWLKKIENVSVKDAFLIEVNRRLIDGDSVKRKTASYIYDKHARQIIKDIIDRCNSSIDEKEILIKEIENYLNKNSKKVESGKINRKEKSQNKTVYVLDGIEYETISIAHFIPYKTKRMALTKKEYVENLTIEKMKNDFPYFSEDEKRNNALNNLFLQHIREYNNDPKEAFNAEGLEKLNKKAKENPKIGNEVKSVTRLDGKVDIEDMFNGGFYETDKGAMAYFIIYENQVTKKRHGFQSIPTHKAIEKIVNGQSIAEYKEGFDTIILSPGNLIYVPTKEERENPKKINWHDKKHLSQRIYKVISFSKKDLLCVKSDVSDCIIPYDRKNKVKGEIGWDNKSTTTMEGDIIIKEVCVKLRVDRLGNIKFYDHK